jgi:hypothetical protein
MDEHAIVIGTNDYRGVRGSAIARCILSECAFYKSEDSAAPDIETYRAIMPAMSTRRRPPQTQNSRTCRFGGSRSASLYEGV